MKCEVSILGSKQLLAMRTIWIFSLVFFPFSTIGQPPPSSLSLQADSLARVGDWEAYLETGYQLAQYWYDQDDGKKAISTARQFIEKASPKLKNDSPALGALYHKLGVYYYVENEYDQAQKAYEKAIAVRRAALGDGSPELSRSIHNLGVAFKEKGNFQSAIQYLLQAAKLRRELSTNTSLLATTYQELGIVYSREGDYPHSLEYFQAALRLYGEAEEGPTYDKARTHQAMGIVYRRTGKYQKALDQLGQAIALFIQLYGEKDSDVADCYNNLGNVYDDMDHFPKAVQYYEKSLRINRAIFGEWHDKVAQNYNNLGYTYTRLSDFDRAISVLQRSLKIRQQLWGAYHPLLSPIYHNLGDINAAEGNLDEALAHYQTAIINSFADFRETDPGIQPDLKKNQLLVSGTDLLEFLRSKARLLQQRYAETQNQTDLYVALETYHTCDRLIDYIRIRYESTESKLFLLENAIPLYEQALETAFILYQQTNSSSFLDQAFHFMEKSKSVLLLAGIREDRARLYAHIPDSLLLQENDFRADIAYFEKRLAAQALEGQFDTAQMKDRLLVLKQDYKKWIQSLEADFPSYYREKYRIEMVDMPALQEMLGNTHSGLVEYFSGEKSLFVFTWVEEEKSLTRISLDFSLTEHITTLLANLSTYSTDPTAYVQAAQDLYDRIWRPLPGNLPERLILIPAGVLGYIPFEVLIAGKANPAQPKGLPYLVRIHQFNYAYSASILLENKNRKNQSAVGTFLGIAPVFAHSPHFSHLNHSAQEISQIQKLLGGDLLVGAEATKSRFLEEASRYRILHISSHAEVVDSSSLLSWIAFSDEKEEDYKLTLSEIYALSIHADMVVLSACETGGGNLSLGEGIMSLSRGFAYAGCQSITTSLWPVNHESTAQIMQHYYQGLKGGLPKDAALRQAKLAYLDSGQTDQLGAHPYYWSAFIHIGDPAPLEWHSNWAVRGLVGGGLFLLFGFILWRWKRHGHG